KRYALVLERRERVDIAKGADDVLDALNDLWGRILHSVAELGPGLVAIHGNDGLRLHALVFRFSVQLDLVGTLQKTSKGKSLFLAFEGRTLDLTSARNEPAQFRLPPSRLDPLVEQGQEVRLFAGLHRSRRASGGRCRRRANGGWFCCRG